MRATAYGLMTLGAALDGWSLTELVSHGLQNFLGHHEGVWVVLLVVGAGITYFGTLVRQRANVMNGRQTTT
jgi:di/tricarboxylate transporter